MEKEFVPYDIALAMKELGFNEECFAFWNSQKQFAMGVPQHTYRNSEIDTRSGTYIGDKGAYTPLYQQAFRWFREEHNQHCLIKYHSKPEYSIVVYNDLRVEYKSIDELNMYNSYEEAQDACLRKLIEIVKENL
jgi:hypothetical protein